MNHFLYDRLIECRLCPRNCGTNRTLHPGYCKTGSEIKIARAALHHWEEPCISGTNGSGAVFFSHCTLGCVFCQNHEISHGGKGLTVSAARLAEIFLELQAQGAHNINLVTPTHYAVGIIDALMLARQKGLSLPVVYNCGGYEKVDTIQMLSPWVDVWLPDFKYAQEKLGLKYSAAPNYPETALSAIAEMLQCVGPPVLDDDGLLRRGVLVRHLLLPGQLADSMQAVDLLYNHFGDDILLSLMSQYTPPDNPSSEFSARCPELTRRVNPRHYDALVDYAAELGITHCYIQDGSAADSAFIPMFDLSGVNISGG
ncbi:radical SAM protein [Oscillospiraceae bacterium LTW-04]|nr:radical SAM protein [Oscillospiraceae bacterium MB24-C1]